MIKKLIVHFVLVVSILFLNILNVAFGKKQDIYPNEKLMTVNGVETLVYFKEGDKDKPLIIFVPGNAHLARISYGYPSGRPNDFLAYWLHQQGFSFLAISYPLDNPVYNKLYPKFNITDWSNLIVTVAKNIIHSENLSPEIIIVGWSMAGSIVAKSNIASLQNKLKLKLFIGLSAVPPIPSIMQDSPLVMNKLLPNGLADRSSLYPYFIKWLDEQNKSNSHEIISPEIYKSQFLGNIPIALGAEGYHFYDNRFVFNILDTFQDSGIFNFKLLPLIGQIHDDSPETLKISLIDVYAWNFLLTQMVYQNYLQVSNLNSVQQSDLYDFIKHTPDNLTKTIHGNHMFFIGQKGARETSEAINALIIQSSKIRDKFHRFQS